MSGGLRFAWQNAKEETTSIVLQQSFRKDILVLMFKRSNPSKKQTVSYPIELPNKKKVRQ